jgi:ATP adenylyltransferase
MSFRRRSREIDYIRYRKNEKAKGQRCIFCELSEDHEQYIDESEYFWIVKNSFPYDLWDDLDVLEHRMIVPRKHTESLYALSDAALAEYGKLLGRYEADGFSIYARAQTVITKSVPHQHTHLIRLNDKQKRFILYSKKPYVLWYR